MICALMIGRLGSKALPKKNTKIIPSRLHLSATHPAGKEKRPNAINPGVAYGMSSAYDIPHSWVKTNAATVAKTNIKKWSIKWPVLKNMNCASSLRGMLMTKIL